MTKDPASHQLMDPRPTASSSDYGSPCTDPFLQVTEDIDNPEEVSWAQLVKSGGKSGLWLTGRLDDRRRDVLRSAWELHPVVCRMTPGDGVIEWAQGLSLSLTLLDGDLMTPELAQCYVLRSSQVVTSTMHPSVLHSRLVREARAYGLSREDMSGQGVLAVLMMMTVGRDLMRYVEIVAEETKDLQEAARKLHTSEGIDFLQRIYLTKLRLYKCQERTHSKIPLLASLSTCVFCQNALTPLLQDLLLKLQVIQDVISNCNVELNLAEKVFLSKIEAASDKISIHLGRIFRIFARLEFLNDAIFVFVGSLSMNITIPYKDDGDLYAFWAAVGICGIFALIIQIFF